MSTVALQSLIVRLESAVVFQQQSGVCGPAVWTKIRHRPLSHFLDLFHYRVSIETTFVFLLPCFSLFLPTQTSFLENLMIV